MVNSSIDTIKAADGDCVIVFTRPKTKPDLIVKDDKAYDLEWSLWLCDGYGDAQFVYCAANNASHAVIIQIDGKAGYVIVSGLRHNGAVYSSSTFAFTRRNLFMEAARLITDEIIRRSILGSSNV